MCTHLRIAILHLSLSACPLAHSTDASLTDTRCMPCHTAAAAPLPVSQALTEAWSKGRRLTWYRRQLPYGYDVLLENLTDPCA
jgi:hypothetical protein